MGQMLNSLGSLQADGDINFYIFIVADGWNEPLYTTMMQNFPEVAKAIGTKAVLVTGLHQDVWRDEVANKYLGKDHQDYLLLLPALIITDTHPDDLLPDSLVLFIPLQVVGSQPNGWAMFFRLMTDFVTGKSELFLDRFHTKEDGFGVANRIFGIKPSFYGISVNINELTSWWRKRKQQAKTPLAR